MAKPIELLEAMVRIRAFETTLSKRKDHGFQLLSSGEEAVAVGLCSTLGPLDQLLTGGRAIGPALACGIEANALMAELLGKADGINGGRAGRGHMSAPQIGFFGAHAVVAGNISVAAGVALARKLDGAGGVAVVLFGDGAAGAGALHETMNIAALWQLPLVFVCNNNQWSVSTRRQDALAPAHISDLAAPYGIWSKTIDGLAVETVAAACGEAIAHVRAGKGPAFLECTSIRLRSHSTTARETRSRETLQALMHECPIARYSQAGLRDGWLKPEEWSLMQTNAEAQAVAAMVFAEASAWPSPEKAMFDVD